MFYSLDLDGNGDISVNELMASFKEGNCHEMS